MTAGRPATPTAKLKATGSYRHAQHKDRFDNVPAKGYPKKPSGLTKVQSDMWDTVCQNLPDDALGDLDTGPLTELVEWYGIYVTARKKLKRNCTDRDARLAATAAFDRWYKLAVEFGMTPRARASLTIKPGAEDDDPFTDLLESMQSAN